jgi:hypothetical protein
MIDVATAHIPNADKCFLAVFSASYFPDAQIILEWVRADGGGNVTTGPRRAWKAGSARHFFATFPSHRRNCSFRGSRQRDYERQVADEK